MDGISCVFLTRLALLWPLAWPKTSQEKCSDVFSVLSLIYCLRFCVPCQGGFSYVRHTFGYGIDIITTSLS